jgi:hypothetical protein
MPHLVRCHIDPTRKIQTDGHASCRWEVEQASEDVEAFGLGGCPRLRRLVGLHAVSTRASSPAVSTEVS